ncbi:RNA polymerase sigma factor [Candidatus Bipolaricaulota bacterium]
MSVSCSLGGNGSLIDRAGYTLSSPGVGDGIDAPNEPSHPRSTTKTRAVRRGDGSDEVRAVSSDETLIRRVANGDRPAFTQLYERHAERVFRFAMSIVRRAHLAEEVLQETMIVVWKRAKTFKGNAKVSTWILGITRNLAFNLLRKEKRGDRLPEEKPNMTDPAKSAETAVHVERALETLPDHHREVMHLVFYEEMNLREAAEILGIPEGTVKSRMHHARKALAKELAA